MFGLWGKSKVRKVSVTMRQGIKDIEVSSEQRSAITEAKRMTEKQFPVRQAMHLI